MLIKSLYKSVLYSESCNKEYTHIVADDTSLGALQPSKASPHRPRHWNISMGILIVQASVMDDNIDTKIQMLQLFKVLCNCIKKNTYFKIL